jgi:LmbE family N-acetylglucosaminyl deacetylase
MTATRSSLCITQMSRLRWTPPLSIGSGWAARMASGFVMVCALSALMSGALVAQVPAAAREASIDGLVHGGLAELALDLRRLDGVKRVLMIGAHPDDEDTSLLTALARGMGAETAYLSLTRGDGGQNLIGPELFEGLGVVRTGELLAARRIDGGGQYFTRAFDFGFSKSADEALRLWPREELLRDVVWVIRSFRPQVIVSVFSGTPRDGHGQHQAAGQVAREAFELAADPTRFADQFDHGVKPWQAGKLYRRLRGQAEGEVLEVETGQFDALLGRSWYQVAMDSRSQHRSQDMGVAQPFGSRVSALTLWAQAPDLTAVSSGTATGLFAGIDTTMTGLARAIDGAGSAGEIEQQLQRYLFAILEAGEALSPVSPWAAAPHLTQALAALDDALAQARHLTSDAAGGGASAAGSDLVWELERRRELLVEALATAAGVVVRATTDDDLVVPGDTVTVTVEVWNGGPFELRGLRPQVQSDRGRLIQRPEGPEGDGGRSLNAGEVGRFEYKLEVSPDAASSRLYFRAEVRDGEMYRWPADPALWGRPFDPAPIAGQIALELVTGDADSGSAVLTLQRAARFVDVDKASGEFSEPVLVVPAVSVASRPGTMVWPDALQETREVAVELRAEDAHGARGRVALRAPDGWQIEPAAHEFAFSGPGQQRTFSFAVTRTNAAVGSHELTPIVELDDGRSFHEAYTLIEYPHLERVAMFDPADTRITVAPVQVTSGLRVGYIVGSGDDGPEALAQMGVQVELVDAPRLRRGDLDGLDALVLGIRVYETQPEIAAANDAILEFARRGGTVVSQYNKYEYPEGGFAPYPVSMAPRAPRVTDEVSPVRLLDAQSPVLSGPNRITLADFDGWVQERGLYFLSEWDSAWVPQLGFTDPGEDESLGSLVVAPVGEGLYVYTGISFFRQFPAGVAGGYRLFANLVSLDRTRWDAWQQGR